MHKIVEVTAAGVIALILVVSLILLINKQVEMLSNFEERAKEALGTDDFEIWSEDIFIARTPDGKQYPPQDVVSQYYRNKLLTALAMLGVAITMFFVIAFALSKKKVENK